MSSVEPDAGTGGEPPEPALEPYLIALHAVAEAAISAALAVAAAGQALAAVDDHGDEAFEYRAAERSLRAALTAFRSALMDVQGQGGRARGIHVKSLWLEDVQLLLDGSAAMDEWQQEQGPFTAAEVARARAMIREMRRRAERD